MRNAQINIMRNADNSSSQTGTAFDVGQVVSASFLGYFGDITATGTLKIQASNDNPSPSQYRGSFVPTNFADIPNASANVTSGGSVLITIPNMCYSYVRAVYTRSSGGTSTINVMMNSLSV